MFESESERVFDTGSADTMIISMIMAITCLGRVMFNSEIGGEGTVDCILWKKASTLYNKEAADLDRHLRNLLLLIQATRRLPPCDQQPVTP